MVATLEVLVSFCIYLLSLKIIFLFFFIFFTSYASSTITHKFNHAFASLLS